jgi:glucan phosphorylase
VSATPEKQRIPYSHGPYQAKANNRLFRLSIPTDEIWQAHAEAKKTLISYANREANSGFDDEVLTIGVARRASLYKRTDLLFTDIERLRSIAKMPAHSR